LKPGILTSPRLHLFLLLILSLATFLGRQDLGGLRSYDDAYYAQKAVEQLEAGGSWVSTHGGSPRYDNPPLHFWATALLYKILGVSRFTAVLATGLFATITVLLVYGLGLAILKRSSTAFLAGLILVLPGFFMDYARRGMLDQTLVCFFTLALAALWLAEGRERRRPGWLLVYGLALGAALLTKSVIGGLILPVALVWLLSLGPRRLLSPGFWLASILGLGLFALWAVMNWRQGGQAFLDEHFAWLILDRAIHDTGEPGWGFLLGYLKLLGQNLWPWLPFTLAGFFLALRAWRLEKSSAAALLVIWVLLPLAVMSLTRNQFLRYLLNIFPALALLAAWSLGRLLAERRGERWVLGLLTGLALVIAALINFTGLAPKGATGLAPQSVDVLALSPAIEAGTPEGESLLNYRLSTWVPRNALLFHAGRWLEEPLGDPAELAVALAARPGCGLLTNPAGFAELRSLYPELLEKRAVSGGLVWAGGRE
jgi:4-amino-4-deoxy-L-arabinose transferase-like glycosyltransferase